MRAHTSRGAVRLQKYTATGSLYRIFFSILGGRKEAGVGTRGSLGYIRHGAVVVVLARVGIPRRPVQTAKSESYDRRSGRGDFDGRPFPIDRETCSLERE